MSKLVILLLFLLSLSSCRSLGSWYSVTPLPVEEIHINDKISYISERVNYNAMIYDLIIINPEEILLEITLSPDSNGLSLNNIIIETLNDKKELLFATNGGIYQEDRTPLGYLSKDGVELQKLNRSEGFGNFYLKPNGVFYIQNSKSEILETEEFYHYINNRINEIPELATQSGPLLLHRGNINSSFTKGSKNKYVRNGVGIIKRGRNNLIVFAISNRPVNFYDFALFFRDFLNCSDALYLDGHISAMYLPSLNRNQRRGSFGTVIYSLVP